MAADECLGPSCGAGKKKRTCNFWRVKRSGTRNEALDVRRETLLRAHGRQVAQQEHGAHGTIVFPSWTCGESTMSPRRTNRLCFSNPKLAQKAYTKSHTKRAAAESDWCVCGLGGAE